MPKRADRASRRQQTVEAYMALIARDGAAAASSRALAAEMGVSTGALWHWFEDMDEVLDETVQVIVRRTDERIASATHGHRGVKALVEMLAEVLPLSKEAIDESYAVVSFWGRVPSNPALGLFQAKVEASWRVMLETHLREGVDDGDLRPEIPVSAVTDVLLVLTKGHQLEQVLGTDLAEPQRQWGVVGTVLKPWITQEACAAAPWT